jgi:peroxiredoxin Q/BCP
MLSIGSIAFSFSLADQDGSTQSLDAQRGKWALLYFYPKDDTPGCTKEACGFRDRMTELKKRGVVIFGISADSVESHKAFAEKFHLIFPLLADTEKKVIEAYGVWGEKEMAGKKYMGIRRMSFLIDPEGKIAKIYEKVNAEEHPEEVLKDLENLQ